MRQKVPIEPLKRAFLDSGLTLSEVCRRADMICNKKPNTSQLSRRLGLKPETSSYKINVNVMLSHAQTIAAAIGVDFDELYEDVAMPEPKGHRVRPKRPKCSYCGEQMIVEAEMCGLCLEEMNSPTSA